MTELLLVRHGETVWHAENRYAGSTNIDLTPRGQQQADALGLWAASHKITAVYSSDLTRAVRTATPASIALGMPLRIDERLREVHFGAGEGLTGSEMADAFPEALAAFRRAPATSPFPGAETGVAAVARALPALEDISAEHPGGRVLVVMHSTLVRLLLCQLLGIPIDRYRTVFPSVRNVAITSITLGGHTAALHSFNVPITEAR